MFHLREKSSNSLRKRGKSTTEIKNTRKTKTQQIVQRSRRSASQTVTHHRQRRFVNFFKRQPTNFENGNTFLRILDFLMRHRQKIGPTVSIIREISTIIKTQNTEFSNIIKEHNSIININDAVIRPVSSTYNFEIANESKIKAFLKKLFGLGQGNQLTVTTVVEK